MANRQAFLLSIAVDKRALTMNRLMQMLLCISFPTQLPNASAVKAAVNAVKNIAANCPQVPIERVGFIEEQLSLLPVNKYCHG